MKNFTNEYIKKGFKKNVIPLIIGIILLILAIPICTKRSKVADEKISEAKNMHETILMGDNEEKYSNLSIMMYYAFADYSDDKTNAYYIVADHDYFYIVYMNKKKAEKITDEDLEKGYRLEGTTKKVPYDVKKLAIDAYNELVEGLDGFSKITLIDFDSMFGTIYLDTTKTKYATTIGYNGLLIFNIMVGGVLFITGLWGTISYLRRTGKLSLEQAMIIDSELNSSNTKYYKKANLALTDNYLINLQRFAVYRYKDIVWIYTHIQKTNGVKTNEQIIIGTKDGKKTTAATTSGNKKMQQIYQEIYAELITKNPEIRIGYTNDNILYFQKELQRIKEEKKLNK